MRLSKSPFLSIALLVIGMLLSIGSSAFAQVTPAAGYTGADDTPAIKIGVTIFTDYTYTDEPTVVDADGNEINPASFDVKRAYINVTGNINHLVAFRVTPDIVRETATGGQHRRKPHVSSQVRLRPVQSGRCLGLQRLLGAAGRAADALRRLCGEHLSVPFPGADIRPTPRSTSPPPTSAFRRTTTSPGATATSTAGTTTATGTPAGRPTTSRPSRFVRHSAPFPNGGMIKGLRLTAFYDADHYARSDSKSRLVLNATFEHKYVNAGIESLSATDQPLAASAEVKGEGWSIWATPRSTKGWEGLLRWDSLKPDKDVDAKKERKVAGVAYWFTALKPAAAALLLDYEHVTYDELLAKPDETRYALHALFNF